MNTVVQTYRTFAERILELLADKQLVRKYGKVAALSFIAYFVSCRIYNGFFGPFSKLPGPFRTKFYTVSVFSFDNPPGTYWEKLLAIHRKYGTVVRLGPRLLSVSDKEMLKQIFSKDDFPKGPLYGRFQKVGSINVFNMRDKAQHKQRRRILAPAFSIKYLTSLEPLLTKVTETFIHSIDRDIENNIGTDGYSIVDIWQQIQFLAIDIIGETAFGETFNMLTQGDHFIPRTIAQNVKLASFLGNNPVKGVLSLLWSLSSILEANVQLKKVMKKMILDRIEGGEAARRDDILQFLIDTRLDENPDNRLDIEAIAQETMFILIAGSETTSSTTGFALVRLLNNPHTLAKLREEIDAVPLEEGDIVFKHEQVKSLPYLNAVLNETMRLDAVGTNGLERYADKDYVLGGNLFVPKGTIVHSYYYHAQTNPDYWPEPMKFWPERWLEGNESAIDLDAYFPFSAGTRNCIGKNFALKEMRQSLATLIKLYDIEAIPEEMEIAKETVSYVTLILKSDSFKVRMKRRSQG